MLLDGKKLHIEDEQRIGRYTAPSSRTIAKLGMDVEPSFATDLHRLQPFSPARDDLREAKLCRLATLDGTFKWCAIHERALIMHTHFVRRYGTRAHTLDQHLVLKS